MTNLSTVDFHGNPLIVITKNKEQLVAMRPICEAIGLAWNGQWERIQRDEVLSTCVRVIRTQLPGDAQSREVAFLPAEYLNGWLFGIDVKRTRPEIRERLIQYKRECYQVLYEHWNKKQPATLPRYKDTISAEQLEYIESILQAGLKNVPEKDRHICLGRTRFRFRKTFSRDHFDIPSSQFNEAVALARKIVSEWEEIKRSPIDTANIELAGQLANYAAKQVAKAVYDAVIFGEQDALYKRYIVKLNPDPNALPEHAIQPAHPVDFGAIVSTFGKLPEVIAKNHPTDKELLEIASVCHAILSQRMANKRNRLTALT